MHTVCQNEWKLLPPAGELFVDEKSGLNLLDKCSNIWIRIKDDNHATDLLGASGEVDHSAHCAICQTKPINIMLINWYYMMINQ